MEVSFKEWKAIEVRVESRRLKYHEDSYIKQWRSYDWHILFLFASRWDRYKSCERKHYCSLNSQIFVKDYRDKKISGINIKEWIKIIIKVRKGRGGIRKRIGRERVK